MKGVVVRTHYVRAIVALGQTWLFLAFLLLLSTPSFAEKVVVIPLKMSVPDSCQVSVEASNTSINCGQSVSPENFAMASAITNISSAVILLTVPSDKYLVITDVMYNDERTDSNPHLFFDGVIDALYLPPGDRHISFNTGFIVPPSTNIFARFGNKGTVTIIGYYL